MAETALPDFLTGTVNLASPRFGTAVTYATDDFFADKARLIDDAPPVFIVGKYDANGKWMDGWETRRRRQGGHDWCLIKLGVTGRIRGVDIDTAHFTGNYPPAASLEGCFSTAHPGDGAMWRPLVATTALGPSAHHYLPVADDTPVNWLRLQMFPDGGIARLRAYGIAVCDWSTTPTDAIVEVSALTNGGRIVAYNNAHFGDSSGVLTAGRGRDMGDGWETRRRREPGNDWLIVALGHAATVERIEVDTAHFKGNYPDSCSLQGARVTYGNDASIPTQAMFWPEILSQQSLTADAIHIFKGDLLKTSGPITHVRFNIYPDGGVSRLRIFGRLAK